MTRFKAQWSAFKPYGAIGGLFALLLTVMKLVEYFILGLDAPNKLQLVGNAILYNLIVISWLFLGLGVAYWLLQLFKKRLAIILTAVLYGILFNLITSLGFIALFCLGSSLRELSDLKKEYIAAII